MKKLLVMALALVTFSSYAQSDFEKNRKNALERIAKRSSPEQRAEIQTKRLALSLDLNEAQQKQVQDVLTSHFNELGDSATRKGMKNLTDEEKHNLKVKQLDAQIALKAKMKTILNEEQFEKFSRGLERRMKQGHRPDKRSRKQK